MINHRSQLLEVLIQSCLEYLNSSTSPSKLAHDDSLLVFDLLDTSLEGSAPAFQIPNSSPQLLDLKLQIDHCVKTRTWFCVSPTCGNELVFFKDGLCRALLDTTAWFSHQLCSTVLRKTKLVKLSSGKVYTNKQVINISCKETNMRKLVENEKDQLKN